MINDKVMQYWEKETIEGSTILKSMILENIKDRRIRTKDVLDHVMFFDKIEMYLFHKYESEFLRQVKNIFNDKIIPGT